MLKVDKKELVEHYKSKVYASDVVRISQETGLSKELVQKCLSVFRLAFKKYIKTDMAKPLRIPGVFTIYKKKYIKTKEHTKTWREKDKALQYKKK